MKHNAGDNVQTFCVDGITLTVNFSALKPGELEIKGDTIIITNLEIVKQITKQVNYNRILAN